MGDTVVMALDMSSYSENAFDWYFEHMHRPKNELVFVHSLDLPGLPTRETFEKQHKESKDKGREVAEKYAGRLKKHGIDSPEFVIDFAKPGEMIVEVAKKKDATVVVMGTRGMGKLARTFLGSVSNYVLNHAPCPVLVIRPKKDSE